MTQSRMYAWAISFLILVAVSTRASARDNSATQSPSPEDQAVATCESGAVNIVQESMPGLSFPNIRSSWSVQIISDHCLLAAGEYAIAKERLVELKASIDAQEIPLDPSGVPGSVTGQQVNYYIALTDEKLGLLKEAAALMVDAEPYNMPLSPSDSESMIAEIKADVSTFNADEERIKNEAHTATVQAEKLLPPIPRCTAEVVRSTYESLGSESDGSIEASVAQPMYQIGIGQCLMKHQYWVEARQVFLRMLHTNNTDDSLAPKSDVLHFLALSEERLGLHKQAVTHIQEAYDAAMRIYDPSQPAALRDSLDVDYSRINATAIHAQAQADTKGSESSWDALSADERKVVAEHGGTRDNGQGYPCHIETYAASGYYEEVWWYGDCDSGDWSTAYRFLNHTLDSTYSP